MSMLENLLKKLAERDLIQTVDRAVLEASLTKSWLRLQPVSRPGNANPRVYLSHNGNEAHASAFVPADTTGMITPLQKNGKPLGRVTYIAVKPTLDKIVDLYEDALTATATGTNSRATLGVSLEDLQSTLSSFFSN